MTPFMTPFKVGDTIQFDYPDPHLHQALSLIGVIIDIDSEIVGETVIDPHGHAPLIHRHRFKLTYYVRRHRANKGYQVYRVSEAQIIRQLNPHL